MLRATRGSLHFLLPSLLALAACSGQGNPSRPSTAAIELHPPSAVVPPGGTVQFAAAVTGTLDTSVTWSVVEAGGGTVSATGSYVAPGAAGTYHVAAASKADAGKHATATVTVQPPPPPPPPPVTVAIAPSPAAVDACGTVAFTAAVTGTTNTAVTWTVQEAAGGTVATTGVYTAPATGGTYHVVATSAAAPAVAATMPVTVTERILGVAVNPPTVTLSPNGTAQFTATVTTTCGAFTTTQAVALAP